MLLRTFRWVALSEGVSYLVLLGVATPLKYYAGLPQAVRVVGMLHGVLFVAYVALVMLLLLKRQWSFSKAGEALWLSVVPFGALLFERNLRKSDLREPRVEAAEEAK